MKTLLLVAIIISTVSASVKPVDIIGGMNPSFEGFVPGAPVVNPNDGSNAYVDNYPRKRACFSLFLDCGVYESQCVGGLLVCKQWKKRITRSSQVCLDVFWIRRECSFVPSVQCHLLLEPVLQ